MHVPASSARLPISRGFFSMRLCRALPLAVFVTAVAGGDPALAREQTFRFAIRHELHALAPGRAPAPYRSEQVGGEMVPALGVTGRVVLSRRPMWVDEGGQLFVQATIPEAIADREHDLDVYVQDPQEDRSGGSLSLRGAMHYQPHRKPYVEPGTRKVGDDVYKPVDADEPTHRVSRTFVFPDLPRGPVMTEVRLRDGQTGQWQEIVTDAVEVPAGSRLHFGFAFDGADARRSAAVEMEVEAQQVDGDGDRETRPRSVTLLKRRARASASSHMEQVNLDLSSIAGRKMRFVFRSRTASGDAASAAGVIWGAATVECEQMRAAYRILMLVSLDSLRTSSVGGYSSSTATPFLSGFFAKEGALMLQATTQAVTTLPAHMTLMTGLNPTSHGVVDETRRLAKSVPVLAEILRDHGWSTAAFTDGGALAGEFGFQRGFEVFDEGTAAEVSPQSADALQRAARWLDQYSGKPLFLFVHTYSTRPIHLGEDASEPVVRARQLADYVDQVRLADQGVRDLVRTTDGRVLDAKSLYIVTSGHGEEFYEHGAAGHGTQLYEESVRVPLMIRGGGIAAAGRYETPVGLVDLAPTILELAGAAAPSKMQGRSFYRVVRGGRSMEMPARFAEAHRPLRLLRDGTLSAWGQPAYSVREGAYKVIFHAGGAGEVEAYDLESDRRERKNYGGWSQPPEWVPRLASLARGYASAAAKTMIEPPSRVVLSPANRSRLESLGYLH